MFSSACVAFKKLVHSDSNYKVALLRRNDLCSYGKKRKSEKRISSSVSHLHYPFDAKACATLLVSGTMLSKHL